MSVVGMHFDSESFI